MLKLENICKKYSNFSLKDIELEVEKNDYYVLLGKSGSGKSMVLEIITGIRAQDSGKIYLNGKDISNLRIQNRNCILVYQDTALFPHMTVYENIAFTLKNHRIKKPEAANRIMQMAGFVSIEHLLKRMPANLSGGEAQRVALARALVVKPDVLLLDEPLSSLDVQLRGGLQSLLHKINQAGQTIIHVTHDFEETLALSNKVAVIEEGRIVQKGITEEVFQNPENEFVAGLSGVRNFFRVEVVSAIADDGMKHAQIEGSLFSVKLLSDLADGKGYLTFKSCDVLLSEEIMKTSAVNNFPGTVVDVVPRGGGTEVVVDVGVKITALISRESLRSLNIKTGEKIWVSFKASACRFIPVV